VFDVRSHKSRRHFAIIVTSNVKSSKFGKKNRRTGNPFRITGVFRLSQRTTSYDIFNYERLNSDDSKKTADELYSCLCNYIITQLSPAWTTSVNIQTNRNRHASPNKKYVWRYCVFSSNVSRREKTNKKKKY